MGLFSRNWDKPGPGVDKDAPKKNAFFYFWELVVRKFFRLITFNILYLLCLLPVVIFLYVCFYSWLYSVSGLDTVVLPVFVDLMRIIVNFVPEVLHAPLVVISALLYGPITMGFTYVLRNFAREEHAWTSDFFTRAWSNAKQGLFFGILDIIALVIMVTNWNYQAFAGDEVGVFAVIIRIVTTVLFVYYLFMRNYFYQLAVTVNLKVGQIIKNAAIFGMIGLWRNIIAVLSGAVVLIVSVILHPLLELILVPTLTFSMAGFAAVYTTYPITDKYIVQPAKALEPKEDERIGFDDLPPAVLPPELGGPGAGAHLEYLSDEREKTEETDENA